MFRKYFDAPSRTRSTILSVVGVHKSVEPWVLFQFEAMHVLSIAISITTKKHLIKMLGDTTRPTPARKRSQNQNKTFQ